MTSILKSKDLFKLRVEAKNNQTILSEESFKNQIFTLVQ